MRRWACIARMGGVGDNLVAASTLRPLKKMGYATEIITSESYSAVFLNNPFLDKLTVKRDGEIPGGDDWQKWFASRAGEYDIFANLSHSMEVRHALQRNSTAFWWPVEYRRKLCAGSYLETVHDIVGVAHDFGPLFFPTEDEKISAAKTKAKIGKQCIGWVISGSRIDKLYPYTPHAIARIIKELDIPVVVIGVGSSQMEHAKRIEIEVKRTNSDRDMFHILVPHEGMSESERWGIRVSLSFALACDLIVTPDTGIAWAVAMEQMPKVLLCSHASVENIASHWMNTVALHADQDRVPCSPCHRLHDDPSTCVPAKDGGTAAACMADISVETIVQNVERLMHRDNVVQLQAAE